MVLKGKVRIDKKTKNLVKRLEPHDIAIISHADLDEVAAYSLLRAKVRAVINTEPSITGKYPNGGPLILIKHNIPLLDNVGYGVMSLEDGQVIEIKQNKIFINGKFIAKGVLQTKETLEESLEKSKQNLNLILGSFIDNTLEYARVEQDLILNNLEVPPLKTSFRKKHILIVVRGHGYREDLHAIKSYIYDIRPVLIGVDGGADALRESGYQPDLIIGDMDSIRDETLACGAELVVHAYPDGHAPGNERLKEMGLGAVILPAPGTSEDVAMLLAYQGGAELIVAVGTHSNVIDFLDKGRRGMASTLLTRMKVGSILVDAKGVSKLYRTAPEAKHILHVIVASLLPILIIASASTMLSHLGRILLLKFRLLFLI